MSTAILHQHQCPHSTYTSTKFLFSTSSAVQLIAPSPVVDNFIQPAKPTVPGGYINIYLQPPPQMTMGVSTNTYYKTGKLIMFTNTYYQTGQPITLIVSNNTYCPTTFNGASISYSVPNGVSYPVTGVTCHPSLTGKCVCPGGVYYNASTPANHPNLPNKRCKTLHTSSQLPAPTSAQASTVPAFGAPTVQPLLIPTYVVTYIQK
eukprot:8466283-Ditylum_brightwellii.AAC.1